MLLPLCNYHHHNYLSLPPKTLTDYTVSPFPITLKTRNNNKPIKKSFIRSSIPDSQTLPQTAIQRIADKLRSLGFAADQNPNPNPKSDSAGEIFVPLPNRLPKYRVGHTLDTSWSSPESPVPEPGSGKAISRFHELRNEWKREKGEERKLRRREGVERVPSLAELNLAAEERRRLTRIGIELRKKLKVGRAGITEGIVNGIHERWRRYEVVKIVCEDLCRLNMKRTHDLLEVRT